MPPRATGESVYLHCRNLQGPRGFQGAPTPLTSWALGFSAEPILGGATGSQDIAVNQVLGTAPPLKVKGQPGEYLFLAPSSESSCSSPSAHREGS